MENLGKHVPDRIIQYDWKDGVFILKLDTPNSKVNTLGLQIMDEVQRGMDEVRNREEITAIVLLSAKPGTFIVGADINMLENCKTAEEASELSQKGQKLVQMIEDFPKPVVVAVNGICLGGGLETVLACHYRMAVGNRKTLFGLPEVMLGILPGLGGTQRLPRLLMLYDAIDIILTGRKIRAEKAKALGLIDRVVPSLGTEEKTMANLEEEAVKAAKSLVNGTLVVDRTRPFLQRLTQYALGYQFIRNKIFEKAKDKVMKLSLGLYPAPLQILKVIQKGLDYGASAGYGEESRAFGELAMTNESKALFGLYHSQTECKKNRIGEAGREVKKVAILGTGLMGTGVAQISLDTDFDVLMKGRSNSSLQSAQEKILKGYNELIKKGKINGSERDLYMAKLEKSTSYENFESMDIIIEAVAENLEIKHEVLQECELVIQPHCVFATNTSSIAVSQIAAVSKRPENVVGMHYFSPVDKMLLLEVVTTEWTSKETAATAVDVGLKQGKVVIVVKDGPGFYTSRILGAMMVEAILILRETQDLRRVNNLTKQLGFPVGIASVVDEIGLDVCLHVAEYLQAALGKRFMAEMEESSIEMMNKFTSLGFLGRKTGLGFFVYFAEEPGSELQVNNAIETILEEYKLEAKGSTTDEDLKCRLLTRFVNEAVLCLQEGILSSAVDGDIGAVFGLGFPPFLGGPFRYVDSFGADKIVEKMREFETHYGQAFSPCQLLLDHASDLSKQFHTK